MSRLTALPRDILLRLLLHHFTAQELIQLRSLCVEVYQLVQYCLELRRTLKLFFSFDDLQFYSRQLYCGNFEADQQLRLYSAGPSNDDLLLNPGWFCRGVVNLLVDRLFPNVRHLIIFLGQESILSTDQYSWYVHRNAFIKCICYLLQKMSSTLTGLSLFGTICPPYDGILKQQIERQFVSRPLIQQINTMQHLRRIDLRISDLILRSDNWEWEYLDNFEQPLSLILQSYLDHKWNSPKVQPQFLVLKPNVLNKLERLCVYTKDEKFIEECLPHLSPRCTELYLVNLQTFTPGTLYRALMKYLNSNVITHLRLSNDIDMIGRILPRFDSLKSLNLTNLYSKSVPLVEVLWLLKRNCPRLIDLKLYGFELNWVSQTNQTKKPKLKHITSLTIKCFTSILQMETGANMNIRIGDFVSALAFIFPNLSSLTLKTAETFFVHDPSNPISKQHFVPSMPQLSKLSIGSYWALEYTCYHLLNGHHRKRFFYEHGLNWLVVHFGNTFAEWRKDETSGLMNRILFR